MAPADRFSDQRTSVTDGQLSERSKPSPVNCAVRMCSPRDSVPSFTVTRPLSAAVSSTVFTVFDPSRMISVPTAGEPSSVRTVTL